MDTKKYLMLFMMESLPEKLCLEYSRVLVQAKPQLLKTSIKLCIKNKKPLNKTLEKRKIKIQVKWKTILNLPTAKTL